MTIRHGVFAALSAAALLRAPAPADAQDVLYELRQGSSILDECLFCDRASIEQPLEGTFLLVPGFTPESFEIHEVDFHDPGLEYRISGSGLLGFGDILPSMGLMLDLQVNDVAGIVMQSAPAAASSLWPAFDLTVKDSEPERHEFHVYTIRLNAAPRVPMVPYELLVGSELVEGCSIPCGRPTILVPLEGSFLLGEITGGASSFPIFRVDAIDFRNAAGARDWRVTGAGSYRVGGQFMQLQTLDLEVKINDTAGVSLASGSVAVEEPFPAIRITLEHQDPASPLFVYTLKIVARPEDPAPPFFRRGDANADGLIDISDAVSMLLHLFSGARPLPCGAATDADFNDAFEITDPIFLLEYLFLGGPAPPPPGPHACGFAPLKTVLDCASFPPCDRN